jgi:type I restriction enzyme S subunit
MAFTITVAELIDADTSGLLGKHPSWERVPLADIASILNGAPFDSALFSTAEGMPLVRIRDVIAGETNTYYTGTYEDAYLVRHGDFLVGMDGDFNSGYWGPKTALLNQRVCKISPVEAYYDKRLLGFTLPGYLAAINANTPSVTVKHLSSKTIGEIDLPLPPRAEQTRIVEKLEELLSDLDAGVAELKAARKKLGQYRQSLLKAAVEGALTAEWRKQNVPVETGARLLDRILLERRAHWEAKQLAKFKEQGKTPPKDWQKKYPEPVQPDTTNLPKLPEGWVWASLEQLSQFVRNGVSKTPNTEGKGFSILRINAVRPMSVQFGEFKNIELPEAEAADYFIAEGDLLATRYNGSVDLLGVVGLVRGTPEKLLHPDKLIRMKPVIGGALGAWMELAANTGTSRAHIVSRVKTTAGQTGISGEDLKKMPVPLLSVDEQLALIENIEQKLQLCDEQLNAIAHSLKQSTAQRKNILKAAFSGQLVPQDPNDEPASVLLERIRAERAAHAAVNKPRGRKVRATTA